MVVVVGCGCVVVMVMSRVGGGGKKKVAMFGEPDCQTDKQTNYDA